MAILGVLLGITMTVLVGVVWYGNRERLALRVETSDLGSRLAHVERLGKNLLRSEAITSAPKPAGVGGQKLRTWNQDIEAADTK